MAHHTALRFEKEFSMKKELQCSRTVFNEIWGWPRFLLISKLINAITHEVNVMWCGNMASVWIKSNLFCEIAILLSWRRLVRQNKLLCVKLFLVSGKPFLSKKNFFSMEIVLWRGLFWRRKRSILMRLKKIQFKNTEKGGNSI